MQTAAKPFVENPRAAKLSPPRFISVDALRGFDMFWIVGGDYLIRSLQKIHSSPVTRELANQMEHCDWAGFHFYDLIFPLFVFIVGVAIPFSIPKIIERNGKPAAIKRIFVRSLVLFALGVLYMGGVANGFKNVYFAGVLHRIAVAYFFAALLFCFFKPRTLLALAILFLSSYWALMTFVPVPGIGEASYEQGKNLAHWMDQQFLPGQKFEGTLLSTLPAVANCLLGIFAGLLLQTKRSPNKGKFSACLASARRVWRSASVGHSNFRLSNCSGLPLTCWSRAASAPFCWACSTRLLKSGKLRNGRNHLSGLE